MTISTEAAERLAERLSNDAEAPQSARYQPYTDHAMCNAAAALRSLAAERDALQAENEKLRATRKWNIERDGEDLLICEGDHEKHEACAAKRWVKADTLKTENARLREALRPFIYTGNVQTGYRVKLNGQEPPPITASEEEAWAHYGGSEFHYEQWRQWRAVHIGKELLGEKE